MVQDIEAARAWAEARFKAPEAETESAAARAERETRERTGRLRAARLARDEVVRKGATIRADRRRST